MNSFNSEKLDSDIVKKINEFIKSKDNDIKKICVNELLRDDVFPLLDKHCTVIYYPTNDKENNGFHVKYNQVCKPIHFVYINTKQHQEKQIFTAAHELGHVWNVDEKVLSAPSNDSELKERIINRFASELLMPKGHFINYIKKELKLHSNGNQTSDKVSINGEIMIGIITSTMNYFFTSYKSVVYRFYELDILDQNFCEILFEENCIELSLKIAKENGYSRLYYADNRKWIDGLKESLDKSSQENKRPEKWLQAFYKKFDLEENNDDTLNKENDILVNIKEVK